MSCNIRPQVEDSLLVPLKLCTTVFCRHLRLGSWVLVEDMAMLVGASCMLDEVAQFLLPHP